MTVPYFQLLLPEGEWSEEMSTDVLVEMFDFAEHTEADLDKVTKGCKIGQEYALICHYYEDDDASFIQTIKRSS